MKRRIVAATAVTLLALTACSGPQIDGGLIVNKKYTIAWVQNITICTGSNPPICTNSPVFHPPTWQFDIWTGSEEDPHGWVRVSESTYEGFEIGDYWSRGE